MYKRLMVALVGLFVLYTLLSLSNNGPFFDEGIYIAAGYRTLEGFGFSDRYLTWFAGSLVWPTMSGVAHIIAGVAGARFLTAMFSLGSIVFVFMTTSELFDDKAAFYASLCYALAGPFLTLSHMAVYDVPALFGMSVAMWGVVMTCKHDHRVYLAAVIGGIALAAVSKYPIAFMTPIVLLMLLVQRPKQWLTDWSMILFVLSAIGLFYFLPVREQLVNLMDFLSKNRPTFGASRAMIINSQLYYAVPMLTIALLGTVISQKKKLALVMILGIIFWPIYHIVTNNRVSDVKHIVFGYMMVAPLVGLFMSRLLSLHIVWRMIGILGICAWAAFGFRSAYFMDRAWPDTKPVADYLLANVKPKQTLLLNNSWTYIMYLYTNRNMETPWDAFDVYRLVQGDDPGDLCSYDWFVEEVGTFRWPEKALQELEACGSYVVVFEFTDDTIYGIGDDASTTTYGVTTRIWRNTRKKEG